MQPTNNLCIIRFGVFEVNVKTGELRKQGARIRLQEQPFQVLVMLLEKPGEIVTREEMQQRLWPRDTFVDFDHSLNKAINKIRDALCDSADNPRFIETLARRGYRFIAPVDWNQVVLRVPIPIETPTPLKAEVPNQITQSTSAPNEGTAPLHIHPKVPGGSEAARVDSGPEGAATSSVGTGHFLRGWNARHWIAVIAFFVVLIILLYWFFFRHKSEVNRARMRVVPFTTLPGMAFYPKFSPDGKLVSFVWNKNDNFDIFVKQVSREGLIQLTSSPAFEGMSAWSPDSGEIAFFRSSSKFGSIYTKPSLGGAEHKLYDFTGICGGFSWSPDGRWLAISDCSSAESPNRIFLLSLDTRQKIPLTSPPPGPYGDVWPEFSRDGKRVIFVRAKDSAVCDIWIQPVSSSEASRLTNENCEEIGPLAMTADGHELVFSIGKTQTGNLYRIPLTGGVPQLVAGIGDHAAHPTIWGDKMVFIQRGTALTKIWRMRGPNSQGKDRSAALILASTSSEYNPDYSANSKKITFNSDRSGFSEIWICDSNGENPVQLTYLKKNSFNPRWSPDGMRIAFESNPEEDSEIYVMDTDAGNPLRMTHEKSPDQAPSWSKDGRWIYFSSNRSGIFQVWKMPSQGGKAIQVTKGGGFYAMESFDGKMVYYIKPGRAHYTVGQIWKVPCDGGEETLVLDREVLFGNVVLRQEGLYFANRGNASKYTIEFFSFKTGNVALIYDDEIHGGNHAGLSISPDGQWLLYSNFEFTWGSNLMLVENFR
jgi:Tol biopolymer transport system component/DNA-binding winged helix-turn-helix (wHTH) protein